MLGSICFLVASGLVIAETHDRLRGMLFRSLESRIAAINMLGSIAFAISAVGAFVVPSTGELLSLPLVNIFTFVGAVLGAAAVQHLDTGLLTRLLTLTAKSRNMTTLTA